MKMRSAWKQLTVAAALLGACALPASASTVVNLGTLTTASTSFSDAGLGPTSFTDYFNFSLALPSQLLTASLTNSNGDITGFNFLIFNGTGPSSLGTATSIGQSVATNVNGSFDLASRGLSPPALIQSRLEGQVRPT